jgi:Integrase core domain
LGSAQDPGGAGAAWVQSFGKNGRQVYATNPSSRAVHHLAVIPEAGDLGVRFLLRPNHHVSNPVRVLRDPSRQPASSPCARDGACDRRVDAQQIVECCAWDRKPRFLVHDRDSCYAASFDRRVRNLGINQARTPFRSPRANAIAERWVRSVRTECLDHVFIFNECHLQKVLAEYVGYFNRWRPHRSIGQRAPCAPAPFAPHRRAQEIVAIPVLGSLHHVYQHAA